MIISRTPFRISFAGGGTDLPDYYQTQSGCVTSTAITKYMYITVHQPFDHRIRLKYSKTELVDDVQSIEHPIMRAALTLIRIEGGIEITSVADIPAKAGLGSSSSFTVGLLHALHAYKGQYVSAETLAKEACEIEIGMLGEPIGKQDQYIAAYGGFQHIQFNPDESVFVDPIIWSPARKQAFVSHLMLFHCGGNRSAGDILKDQKQNIPQKRVPMARMADLARALKEELRSDRDIRQIGDMLHEAWLLKRGLSHGISNLTIDRWYETARQAGALGGKLLGAGGGGFLLFFVEPDKQRSVSAALSDLRQIPFDFEPQGSKIIYVA